MPKMIQTNLEKANYLVCVNTEKYSEIALHFACQMARKNNASIMLLHVVEPVDYQSFGMVAEKMYSEMQDDSQKLLNELTNKASQWCGVMPIVIVRDGFIEDEIIAVVEEYSAIKMLITGASPENSKKSRIIPPLVSALGSKLNIPMLIVPGTITSRQMEEVI